MKINGYLVLEAARREGTQDGHVILAYSEINQEYVVALLYRYDPHGPEPTFWDNGDYFKKGSHPMALRGALESFTERKAGY